MQCRAITSASASAARSSRAFRLVEKVIGERFGATPVRAAAAKLVAREAQKSENAPTLASSLSVETFEENRG
jgi:hypothetical protein